MNKYHNSKIYKITDNTSDKIYIGSTIQTLQQRLQGHKSSAKSCKDGYGCASKQIIDNGDYTIGLLEEFQCETKKELCQKEQEYLDKYIDYNLVNKVKSHITPEDMKARYWKNRDFILVKKKAYDSVYHTCECGGGYSMSHRARHLKSKRCQEYFNKKNQSKLSFLYKLMSEPMNLLTLIKRLCKERNIPITDKQLSEIKDKVKEEEEDAKDEDYESVSEESSEDYDEGDMVVETFTIGRTKDGHYLIM
jgi:hypothetical protein